MVSRSAVGSTLRLSVQDVAGMKAPLDMLSHQIQQRTTWCSRVTHLIVHIMDQKFAQITYIVEYIENLTRTSKYIITVDCMTIGTSTLL